MPTVASLTQHLLSRPTLRIKIMVAMKNDVLYVLFYSIVILALILIVVIIIVEIFFQQ